MEAHAAEDQNMILQVLAELDGGGQLAKAPGDAGEAAPLPSDPGPPAPPDQEACTHTEEAGNAELPMKAEDDAQPGSAANTEVPTAVEQAAAADEPAKGSKRKAGTSLKQPSGKPRAKWRHTEVGAVPAAQAGLQDIGAAETTVTPGFAKSCKRKPGKLTLADYPSIARRWHPTKNDGRQPEDHKHASKERVWLQCGGCPVCAERHQWDARVDNLTQYGDNLVCPFCTSKGPSFCSCRSVAKHARLASEWHEANPSATTVALGNDKKHRWRCSDPTCLHVWDASPNSRYRCAANCPECARKRKGKVKHASLAVSLPVLAMEWDVEKNGCSASDISCGSKKKGWWVCRVCKEPFEARVQARALLGTGCPACRKAAQGKPASVQ